MMNFMFVLVVCLGLYKSCSGLGFFSLRLPNDNAFDKYLRRFYRTENNKVFNLNDYAGEKCARPCTASTETRICYFHWTMEHFQAMGSICKNCSEGVKEDCLHPQCITADGFEKGVMSINRKVPGPPINVCKGDEIIVDVQNEMLGTSISMHWHGLHQKGTPFMDGVPYITQCPIIFGNTFRYRFVARKPGSFLYHSHAGHHKVNGQYGALIIREPKENDRNSQYYNFDELSHFAFASDWLHQLAESYVPGPPSKSLTVDSVLINGRGMHYNKTSNTHKISPLSFFRVKKGGKYRFRFINGESHSCPMQFQIENHTMLVIAADAYSVRPVEINTLYSTSGERYDFVLDANQVSGNYFLRLRSVGYCEENHVETFAVLSYQSTKTEDIDLAFPNRSVPDFEDRYPLGTFLNYPNFTECHALKDCIHSVDLQSYEDYDGNTEVINAVPDHRFYVAFSSFILPPAVFFDGDTYFNFMTIIDQINIIATCNNISYVNQKFNLLGEKHAIDEDWFCDENNRPASCNATFFCFCTHRIKMKRNSIIEIIVYDETEGVIRAVHHPFHMHGHQFLVTGMGQQDETLQLKKLTRQAVTQAVNGNDKKMLTSQAINKHPSFRDTVTVPSKGYIKIKFKADNPGFWFLHCHFEWHLGIGMSMLMQVGEVDEMITPPQDFPKCGDYTPDVFGL